MKFAAFTFKCRLTATASFSAYKGSMLRGTLGAFLKRTCCTMRQPSCDDCMLSGHCSFPLLFIGKYKTKGNRGITLPPPYCIEPNDTGKTIYEAGEYFSFNVILLSYAVDYLPYFVHAFVLAGQKGMGKNTETMRGTFELEDILYQEQSIFSRETHKVAIPAGEDLMLPAWITQNEGDGTLLVHLKTPCRFKADNHLSADLSFRQIFNLVVRRIRTVWELESDPVYFDNFPDMQTKADSVKTLERHLFWKDWTRYSSRQKVSMQLGGLQGSVSYGGNLQAFLPFFALAEKLHIGKQTSFGLGQISIHWKADEQDTHSPEPQC
ncbi:MAG: CRISPR system precrRNA processing endoribonuclease RAMP protein Cas6 [Desulfovibrio sp.]|nr:CRISPR system precrRNA processing endoribonuclease RAMP protein Cas6 [Desulfovibrio sp.]